MGRWTRFLAILPLLLVLGFASARALDFGSSGQYQFTLVKAIEAPAAVKGGPPVDFDESHRRLLELSARVPSDPSIHELLGVLDIRRGKPLEYAAEAAIHFSRAIELRPTSPYSWANLAAVHYRIGETGPRFETAIVRAGELGPWEPEVQRTVTSLGLAVWDEVSPRTRAAVEAMVARGMSRKPLEMLQIADNRGRLAVACRHLPGSPRLTDPKWSQLCQSMEAS